MTSAHTAVRAYAASKSARDPRQQEADVFLRINHELRSAQEAKGRARLRALIDNRRLWDTVIGMVSDPDNGLPPHLRGAIVSVGMAVQRAMEQHEPDFGFLIAVNEQLAEGLSASSGPAAA